LFRPYRRRTPDGEEIGNWIVIESANTELVNSNKETVDRYTQGGICQDVGGSTHPFAQFDPVLLHYK